MEIPLYKVHMPEESTSPIEEVLRSGRISSGPNVACFETLLQEYFGNPWVTTTSDMSTSLTLCLYMAGVRPGDEVVMSPLVCLATSCPVRNLFAEVRWCDVDPLTGNLDPEDLQRRISAKTKAIVVFHWAGNPADLDAIHAIARSHGIPVIEDASEALGAEYRGQRVGNCGSDFTVFSFYPNRHITTIDGGAITFARKEDYERGRWLKRYGIHQPSFRTTEGEINPLSEIDEAGWNCAMHHVAATLGVAQMGHLPELIRRRVANGEFFDRALQGVPGVTLLRREPRTVSAYWVYTFLAERRDELLQRLRGEQIGASKVHLRNDIYACFGGLKEQFPGVDEFERRSLSVPCGHWLSEDDRESIVACIKRGG